MAFRSAHTVAVNAALSIFAPVYIFPDENRAAASDGVPSVGVAIRVLSPNDPDFEDKCKIYNKQDVGTCPKPQFLVGIRKRVGDVKDLNNQSVWGPIYTSVGVFGDGIDQETIADSVNNGYFAAVLENVEKDSVSQNKIVFSSKTK